MQWPEGSYRQKGVQSYVPLRTRRACVAGLGCRFLLVNTRLAQAQAQQQTQKETTESQPSASGASSVCCTCILNLNTSNQINKKVVLESVRESGKKNKRKPNSTK